ncbi:MAG: cytochrome c-type biogenesis protein CcmH [Alphaproteobacteria bacterium]|nr:cytochrome c-type biogenesis protein CcmH [Alphaproteobacteria bacterium]
MRKLLFALFLILGSGLAHAVMPDEMLADPALEARAREISQNLRCLVCQNQSIDDSNASLAKDLRVIVRERLTAGDSNEQVMAYVVKRYGNYVLLKPPFQADTALLWLLPFLLMLAGLGAAYAYLRQQPAPEEGETTNDILKED